MKRFLSLVFILVWLAACTSTTETAVPPKPDPETAIPATQTIPPPIITEEIPRVDAPTAVPDPTLAVAEPTTMADDAKPEPVIEEVVAETGVISGRTEEGAFFLGDPNAPITHIDYSDFL